MANLYDLPNEILIGILEYLDYFTLNLRLRPVCRLFNGLLRPETPTGPLSEVLFRHKSKDNRHNGQTEDYCLDIHPCIPLLVAKYHADKVEVSTPSTPYGFNPDTKVRRYLRIDDVGFYNPITDKFTPLSETDIANENALAPSGTGSPTSDFWWRKDSLIKPRPFVQIKISDPDPTKLRVADLVRMMSCHSVIDRENLSSWFNVFHSHEGLTRPDDGFVGLCRFYLEFSPLHFSARSGKLVQHIYLVEDKLPRYVVDFVINVWQSHVID